MLARIFSCAVIGLEGVVVEVEVDYTNGLPGMTLVGLPDAAVQESRERVQTAVKNAGLHFPRRRIVVNLSTASIMAALLLLFIQTGWPPSARKAPTMTCPSLWA